MAERGTLTIGRFRGAPIMVHWSLALGLMLFSRFQFVPGFWLGFTLLILFHELGHAYLVKRLGHAVHAVVIHGFGGYCRWDGGGSRLEHSVVAWGGVLAQAVLLCVTLGVGYFRGPATSLFELELRYAFTETNLWIMALNLLPFAPLDGAEAWQLFRAMRVEGVRFSQIVKRCLPLPSGKSRPKVSERRPKQRTSRPPPPPKGNGRPSEEAQTAIADALRRIAEQAGEAKKKK
jgi:Zn-dependent protease